MSFLYSEIAFADHLTDLNGGFEADMVVIPCEFVEGYMCFSQSDAELMLDLESRYGTYPGLFTTRLLRLIRAQMPVSRSATML